MQTSGISGHSAVWALRQLFQPQHNAGQQNAGDGQFLPTTSAGAAQGLAAPSLSPGALSAVLGLQSPQAGRPAPLDFASGAAPLIASLDTDGDGSISQAEAEASGSVNADQAFAALDANGDGSISSDELSNALQNADQTRHAHHGRHHHKPSASDAASYMINALNTDGQNGLTLDEVTGALGSRTSSSEVGAGFSALDTDGNRVLSLTELRSAINQYLQTRLSDGASQEQQQVAVGGVTA